MIKDTVFLKSKENKAFKIALTFAIVIIFIMLLIFFSGGSDEENGVINGVKKLILPAIGIGILYLMIVRKSNPLTQYDIIKNVADSHYEQTGKILNTYPTNTRVSRGGIGETYIEFIDQIYTFLFLDGVGIVESYPGLTIEDIKRVKQDDKITMQMARAGIVRHAQMDKLDRLGLLPDEEDVAQ